MANSISFKDGADLCVINADMISFAWFMQDGTVHIQFNTGDLKKFDKLNDRDKEALKRALRISPS